MGRRTIVAACVLALMMALSSTSYASARRKPPRNCAPPESAVLLSDPHAEVFQYRFGIYDCLRRGGPVGYLGHTEYTGGWDCVEGEERCGVVSDEALAGTVVAYTELRLEPSGRQPEHVVVRNLVTGRAMHDVSLHVATVQRTMLEEARAVRVAVNGEGAVAWIQEDQFGRHDGGTPPPTVYDVFAIDSDGFHSLRTDLPARPGSLKLTSDTLSWRQSATPESAVLD
jgi:hypothetical protein